MGRIIKERFLNLHASYQLLASYMQTARRDFSPCLAMNKVPTGISAGNVMGKLQGVIRRYLGKEVPCLSVKPFHAEVEQSVMELVQVMAEHPKGVMAKGLAEMLRSLSVE